MYAVIEKTTYAVLRTCSTKEAAIVACQLEKDKVGVAERGNITAVTMDAGGHSEIMF
jgi:DNA/RNA endonuclease G (NUC1)